MRGCRGGSAADEDGERHGVPAQALLLRELVDGWGGGGGGGGAAAAAAAGEEWVGLLRVVMGGKDGRKMLLVFVLGGFGDYVGDYLRHGCV